ncbi:hypothetical protein [Hyphococcus sp.]|uniref:hypothetical protein n=1 Tax=Hyphococcus sp. TaxID=2038636 RepID=UPI0035C71D3C
MTELPNEKTELAAIGASLNDQGDVATIPLTVTYHDSLMGVKFGLTAKEGVSQDELEELVTLINERCDCVYAHYQNVPADVLYEGRPLPFDQVNGLAIAGLAPRQWRVLGKTLNE